MKKTVLLALMAIVATTTVTAQDFEQRGERRAPDPEKRVEHQVKRLEKKLKLSEDQKKEVQALPTNLLEAIRTVRPEARFYQASTSEMFVSPPALFSMDKK